MYTDNNPLLTYGQSHSITSSFAIKHAMRNVHIKRNSEKYKSQFSLLLKMILTYKNETLLRLKRLNITVKQKLSQSSQITTSSNINVTKLPF